MDRMKRPVLQGLCGAVSVFCLASAATTLALDVDEAGFSYGLDTELRYDDNIYRSQVQEVDSLILQAIPFIRGTIFNNGNAYQATYTLDHGEYFDSSADTYTDHSFQIDLNHRFTDRQAAIFNAAYNRKTEQRGTGFSEEPNSLVDGPDEYKEALYKFAYLIGAPSADMRLELRADRSDLNFDSSYVGDTRDYTSDTLGALLRYKIGARTDLVLEYRNQDVSYDNTPVDNQGNALNLDANEDYYLAGVAWEITGKTKGEVKLGRSDRDYDDGGPSVSDFHWEAQLTWRPKSYSEFVLNTGRQSLETYGSGFYINVRKHELAWNHGWTSRISSTLQASIIRDDYEESLRSDDQLQWRAAVNYDLLSWIDIGAGYTYNENDSNFDIVDYQRNVFFLKAEIEL